MVEHLGLVCRHNGGAKGRLEVWCGGLFGGDQPPRKLCETRKLRYKT